MYDNEFFLLHINKWRCLEKKGGKEAVYKRAGKILGSDGVRTSIEIFCKKKAGQTITLCSAKSRLFPLIFIIKNKALYKIKFLCLP